MIITLTKIGLNIQIITNYFITFLKQRKNDVGKQKSREIYELFQTEFIKTNYKNNDSTNLKSLGRHDSFCR